MLDFLTTTSFTMLYDHRDHEIMVMVGMIGVDGYVLNATYIRRRYEASGND